MTDRERLYKRSAHLYDLVSVYHARCALWTEEENTERLHQDEEKIRELKSEIIELEAEIYI